VAVAYRGSEQLGGPARRMVDTFPFAKDVLGWSYYLFCGDNIYDERPD
jgi:hypothetical protein